jgi:hypothetical protein
MKKSTKTKVLVVVTAFTLIAGIMSCDNGTTTETARDVKIAEYQGKNIYVNCLPSQENAVKGKIKTAVEDILDDTDAESDTFKDIVGTHGLKIIIENGTYRPGYSYGNNGILKFHYTYLSHESITVGIIKNDIRHGVNDNMAAMLNKQFNNIRMVHFGIQWTHRQV